MKIPRDLYGRVLANHLIRRWSFRELRQTGSHIVIRTEQPSGSTISIPAHKPVRLGTLSSILTDVAEHKQVSVEKLLEHL